MFFKGYRRSLTCGALTSLFALGCSQASEGASADVEVKEAAAANWSCPMSPDTVTVWSGSDFSGTCFTLATGNHPFPLVGSAGLFGLIKTMTAVQSIVVGSAMRGIVNYTSIPFPGRSVGAADYEPARGYTGAMFGNAGGSFAKVSSVDVQPTSNSPLAHVQMGNYPSDRENFWSGDAQGIAHNAESWFLTRNYRRLMDPNCSFNSDDPGLPICQEVQTGVIYRVPLSMDLSSDGGGGDPNYTPTPPQIAGTGYTVLPQFLMDMGYWHFGDPEVFGPYVFVPVEGPGLTPIVVAYRTSDLSFASYSYLSNPLGTQRAAWLTINANGALMTSDHLTAASGIFVYLINMYAVESGEPFLQYLGMPWTLTHRDGSYVDLHNVQGGDLSDDGTLLYISNGCCGDGGNDGYGLRVFDLNHGGVMLAKADQYFGPFIYQLDAGFPNYQEPEGLDYFDTFGLGLPRIPESQLHVILYSNLSGSVWLKHYQQ